MIKDIFYGDKLAQQVFNSKYSKGANSPQEAIKRETDELNRMNVKLGTLPGFEDLTKYLSEYGIIITGGSIKSGLGLPDPVSLSNCFVIDSSSDSISGIAKMCEEMDQLSKRRGGIGTELSVYRPAGALVNNAANSSTGVVPIAQKASDEMKYICQNGRRGALMLSLDYRHPDSIEFIRSKHDISKITNANISVRVNGEDLYHRVENNMDLVLRYPVDMEVNEAELTLHYPDAFNGGSDSGKLISLGNNTYIKVIPAKLMEDEIAYSAWKSAEPGVLWFDNILRESVTDCYPEEGFTTTSTNPCFTGRMALMTPTGPKTFESLYREQLDSEDKEVIISNVTQSKACRGKITYTGFKNVITLNFSDGKCLECTPEHILRTESGEEIEAQNTLNEVLEVSYGLGLVTEIIPMKCKVPVYDFTIEDDENPHWGIVNGIVAHNCGEIPLSPYDSCRLIAVNWYSFVDNPFTDHAEVNYKKINEYTRAGIIALDNVIELELEKIDMILAVTEKGVETDLWLKVREAAVKGRRTGFGPTGIADFFAALNIKYDSDEAIELAEEVQKRIAIEAYRTSHELAKIRGNIPFLDLGKELQHSDFIKRLSREIGYYENGRYICPSFDLGFRRNIALLTAAPTGTASIIARCSNGIEPVFEAAYKRYVVVNPSDNVDESRIVIIDGIKKYVEFNIHPGMIKWYSIKTGLSQEDAYEVLGKLDEDSMNELVLSSPYAGVSSSQIDPQQKIKLQGALQKWIDHSISVTHNLVKSTTKESVKEIYKSSYFEGCKGCTIYRDGSRSGVMVKDEPKNKDKKKDYKRPKRLVCKVIRFRNGGEKWIGLITIRDNRPYELFTGLSSKFPEIPNYIDEGWVDKNYHGTDPKTYDFGYMGKDNIEVVAGDVSRITDREFWNYGRLISGLLRSGTAIEFIYKDIEHIKFDNDNINNWKAGVLRALGKYIKERETKTKCPECNTNMNRIEGCLTCPQCGHSLCG